MLKKYLLFFFLIYFTTITAFGNSHEFIATGTYTMLSCEQGAIAETRALTKAKAEVVELAFPEIKKYLNDKGIKFTKDLAYSLLLTSLEMNMLNVERVVGNAGSDLKVKVRGTVLYSELERKSTKLFIKGTAENYVTFIEDLKKNEAGLKSFTAKLQLPESESKRNDIEARIRIYERQFQGLIFFEEGLKFFLLENYDAAIKLLTKAIDAYPEYINSYQYRGISFKIIGQNESASRDFTTITQLDPKNANAYFNLGSLAFEKNLLDLAIEKFNKAIALDSSHDDFFNNRGSAFIKKEEFGRAIADFTKAIMMNGASYAAYYNRGYAHYLKGDYRKSIDDCSKALSISKLPEAFFVRSMGYAKIGEKEKAKSDIEISCKLNYEEACKVLNKRRTYASEYNRAWSLYQGGEAERALEAVKNFNDPNDEGLIVLTGLIYIKLNRPKDALSSIGKLKLISEEAYNLMMRKGRDETTGKEKEIINRYYFSLKYISGMAHFQLNDCDQSLNDLLIYVPQYPDIDIYNMIGICYYKKGKYAESLIYFNLAYKSLVEGPQKDSAAYSIASLYALQDNVEEVIRWLEKPLQHEHKSKILEKIKMDKDFDKVRGDKRFVKFLNKFE